MDKEIKENISIYEELFPIYTPNYCEMLKYKGEFFIDLYSDLQKIPKERIMIKDIIYFKHKLWSARMILGIGCELIIRAAYLNKGFIINKFLEKKSLPPKIKERNFPSKFKDFKHLRNGIYPYLKNKTYSMKDLIEKLPILFEEDIDKDTIKGFEISKIWRDIYAHTSEYPYSIYGDENQLIFKALNDLYKKIFNEEFEILKDKDLIA